MRLNKYLAETMGLSRREADNLIAAGKVKLNGAVAELGARIPDGVFEAEQSDASSAAPEHFNAPSSMLKQSTEQPPVSPNSQPFTLEVDGKTIDLKPKHYTYIMLNKPVGYVCSRKRQGDTPTLYELLPQDFQGLKTVGRLDKDSSGLILLTDDGDFTFKMTHPKFYKTKIYVVTLDKDLEPLHQQMISDFGINLEDGPSKLTLTRIDDSGPEPKLEPIAETDEDAKSGPNTTSGPEAISATTSAHRKKFLVEMHEGRNRQIRRTFRALGYEVKTLHRLEFGEYKLNDLPAGKFTKLVLK